MTCREKFKLDHPTGDINSCCPDDLGYVEDMPGYCVAGANEECDACWDREIPEENESTPDPTFENVLRRSGRYPWGDPRNELKVPHILDSGERREFESGAVRDIQEGKGRCDLVPLDVVSRIYSEKSSMPCKGQIIGHIYEFTNSGKIYFLIEALDIFLCDHNPWDDGNWSTIFLEVSKHFEEGAKKYGEHNWQKGIPTHCYIDSAVRHYLKFVRGDVDEPHDRAFVWNILCCIWTCIHKPEFNDYGKEVSNEASR